ncbi:cytidine deaminase [Methylobacillus sp.]|uniref:cytidine deaminase n=1 Tax=Methylobacillus sp. TaxID=56818 RepID=UPI00257B22AC|nr:cytidine deaminase [Methylobacillus sp.]
MDYIYIDLLEQAQCVAAKAYAKYSNFRVGSAILSDAGVFIGANVENSSTNLGICAERVALSNAIIGGIKSIQGIAVFCLDVKDDSDETSYLPCGACLQWMAEFQCVGLFSDNTWIVTNGSEQPYNLKMLLPKPFKLTR